MPLKRRLVPWVREFLPDGTPCAHAAAALLLRAFMYRFTTHLTDLARQAGGDTTVNSRRQRFDRWLARPGWDREAIYAGCCRQVRRLLRRRGLIPLVVDFTDLEEQWSVLQVSVPWEKRALPIYRVVVHRTDPEEDRRELLREMLWFLRASLSGSPADYVLVADRGFPGHWLVRQLQREGWHFVFRVTRRWKVKHAEYTGALSEVHTVAGLVGPCPRRLVDAEFGRRGKGADEWSVAHLVLYHGEDYEDPWYLVTTETAEDAVALYAERAGIECEFKDVKGPWGLDELAHWPKREEVARFLAMVAMHEWHLAYLWVRHQLEKQRRFFTKYGRLSWFRITVEWIHHHWPSLPRLPSAAWKAP